MIKIKLVLLVVVTALLSGCGSFAAGISHGPTCPYQGVGFDFALATDWNIIKKTYGLLVPLTIVDLPFSFVIDTFALGKADGGDLCPRKFN